MAPEGIYQRVQFKSNSNATRALGVQSGCGRGWGGGGGGLVGGGMWVGKLIKRVGAVEWIG